MAKLTPEQLRELYLKLPEDLREAIFSVASAEVIQAIGKKYNLTVDKMGALADETGLVMLGLTHPNDFVSNLSQRLNVVKENAREIAEEINAQIFANVRESLKKVHGITPTPEGVGGKEEVLKEIEKEEIKEPVPAILQGATQPPSSEPALDTKKEEIVRMPTEEKKYPSGDPYREPLE